MAQVALREMVPLILEQVNMQNLSISPFEQSVS